MHAFLSNPANRQTDRQTRAKTCISSFVGGKDDVPLYVRVKWLQTKTAVGLLLVVRYVAVWTPGLVVVVVGRQRGSARPRGRATPSHRRRIRLRVQSGGRRTLHLSGLHARHETSRPDHLRASLLRYLHPTLDQVRALLTFCTHIKTTEQRTII